MQALPVPHLTIAYNEKPQPREEEQHIGTGDRLTCLFHLIEAAYQGAGPGGRRDLARSALTLNPDLLGVDAQQVRAIELVLKEGTQARAQDACLWIATEPQLTLRLPSCPEGQARQQLVKGPLDSNRCDGWFLVWCIHVHLLCR